MMLKDFYYQVSQTTEGKAPWIIFLHGLLGASRNWFRIVPEFTSKYNVLNLDQRGHGKSFKPDSGYGPVDFATDLKFIMDELKIPRAILVGHSMGGRNALVFSEMYPEMVQGLVIEDIGPEHTYENGLRLINQLTNTPTPFPDKKRAKEYFLGEFGDPQLGDFLYTHIVETSAGAVWDFKISMVEEIINKGRSQNLWPAIKKLTCPTLWLRGEQSLELLKPEFEKILQSNPCIKGVEFAGAGHLIHFYQPEQFIKVLSRELENMK